MIEHKPTPLKALLVHVDFFSQENPDFNELRELTATAGFPIAAELRLKRDAPDAKFFIGSGRVEEIKSLKSLHDINLIIFNHDLSPSQERNLERELKCDILSRTGLIIEIFSQRARSHEGQLQVKLAQLEYQSTRLVRTWTHLERQRGGIGVRGGPGETQLEIDKRLLRKDIKQLKAALEKVKKQRQLGRGQRQKSDLPTLSLVGYTNAGKSTVFNLLTDAKVYAANQLFATLDPCIRKIMLPYFGEIYLIDTVGFIRHLPHRLIEAFQATLEETVEADLLLHVIDASNPEYALQREQVERVLEEIGALEHPCLEVMNKIDLLTAYEPHIKYDKSGRPLSVFISALKKQGIDLLWRAMAEALGGPIQEKEFYLKPQQGALYAHLKALKIIQHESVDAEGQLHLRVQATQALLEKLHLL